jgi:cysteine synthase
VPFIIQQLVLKFGNNPITKSHILLRLSELLKQFCETRQPLKEFNSDVQIIEMQRNIEHRIEGIKNLDETIISPLYSLTKLIVDENIRIETENVFEITRKIISEEGIFVEMSAREGMEDVLKILRDLPTGAIVFVIFPDRGNKYLSTSLFLDNKNSVMMTE